MKVINEKLVINIEDIKEGLLQNLTGNEVKVLLAIAIHADENGECYPSQTRLGSLCNLANSTISLTINSLLRKKFKGKPILKRVLVGGTRKKSYYSFNTEEVGESKVEKAMTAPQVLKLFMNKYEEVYKIPYKPNYRKDCGMIKKQLLGHYEEEQIPVIIDIAVTEYDKRWKNRKFPSITVGALCSWIAQEALKISADREKKVTDRTDKYAGLDEDEEFEI